MRLGLMSGCTLLIVGAWALSRSDEVDAWSAVGEIADQ